MALADIASDVVRGGSLEEFVVQAQQCTSAEELTAAAEVLALSDDVDVNIVLGNLLYLTGAPAGLEPLVLRVAEAFERGDGSWERALLLPLQHETLRMELPHRDRLLAAVPTDAWLYGLLKVLDLEPLVVLHRPSGTGYEVTIGGIGDNFQLHTLLAYRLIGPSMIPGTPPEQSWVEAASIGEELEPAGGIRGQFELWDALGGRIWNGGRPSDIPFLNSRRVVVLDVPAYERSWNAGRVYPLMTPLVQVDRMLPPDEAAAWLAQVVS